MLRRRLLGGITAMTTIGLATGRGSQGLLAALGSNERIQQLRFDSTCSLLDDEYQPSLDASTTAVRAATTATTSDQDGAGDAVTYPEDEAIPLVAVDGQVAGFGAMLVADEDADFSTGVEEFLLNVWDELAGSGTILWDESHDQYWTLSKFTAFETYAESHGYDVRSTADYETATGSKLVEAIESADASGIVITSPSTAITGRELSELRSFVDDGGALFLHSQSDYQDFDETEHLNELAEELELSVRFNDDQVIDSQHNDGADFVPLTSNFNTDFPFFESRAGISNELELRKDRRYDVTVETVSDGDTVDVRFPTGQVETIRVLGVDTPESADNAQFERPEEWPGIGRRAPPISSLTFGSTSSLLNAAREPLTDGSMVALWASETARNEDADGNGDTVSYPENTPIPLVAIDDQVAGFGAMLVDDGTEGGTAGRSFDADNEEFLLNVWDQLVGPGSTVVFDDGHDQYYGSDRFQSFFDYARAHGYAVESTDDIAAALATTDTGVAADVDADTKVTADADAVVVTSPGSAFDETELAALSEFVDAGGTLLLHDQSDYDDFDHTTRLNEIADAVGAAFRFNDDQVLDDENNAGRAFLPRTSRFNETIAAVFGDRAGLGAGDSPPEPNYPVLADWADRATSFAETELAGKTVTIGFDETEPLRDQFGRLLAYVTYDDEGTDVLYNRRLLEDGYARAYGSSLSRHDSFLDVQQTARETETGLWAASDPEATPPIRNRPVDELCFPKPASVGTETGPLDPERVPVAAAETTRRVEGTSTPGTTPLVGLDETANIAMVGAPIISESYERTEDFAADTSGYENFTFLTNLVESCSERTGPILIDGGHGQFGVDWALSAEDAAYFRRYLEGVGIGFEQVNAFADTDLSRGRAIVITTPPEQYEQAEIDAVSAFLDRGGAVILLGSGRASPEARSNLNTLAAELGTDLRLNDDRLVDPDSHVGDETIPTTANFGDGPLFSAFDPTDDSEEEETLDAPTVTVNLSRSSIAVGRTTEAEVVLSAAPNGLAGYRLTVELDDPAAATIRSATYPEQFELVEPPARTPGSAAVTLEAVDVDGVIPAGGTGIPLGTIVVEGTAAATTGVSVTVTAMDDDDGEAMSPETEREQLLVSELEPLADELPRDLDGDGVYEDVDGDGRRSYNDVTTFFEHLNEDTVTEHTAAYDFNGNGRVDYQDVVTLFERVN